ncbi:uncharacterized protein LOC142974134 [Anticarsia gemmatalis]|uniref:uncharacterized protein LOC142974134 n=1 Tax=Anticarsia gemmatalis TaxID=129554 RepID=UPI003F75C6C9
MEWNNIIRTATNNGERVASTYADIYFNDDYCEYVKPKDEESETNEAQLDTISDEDAWQSPSDLLIGIIDLIPPFTSKITRGKTHEGILAIGDGVLARERERFVKYMSKLMRENDAAWNHILEHEKSVVAKKVKEIYRKILAEKSKILMKEVNTFYESSLQELEDHLRKELQGVLVSAHASIISDMNTEIKEKLKKEKAILEKTLQQRYDSEVKKIKLYYKLLLENEFNRHQKLVNQALYDRNDALKAFYRQIEAENTTSTMYMMCTERKKCKIKQFLLDNYHGTEVAEKLKKIKERQDVINAFKERERHISDINKEWEEKTKKILQLFLKFVSFSLKLLPEQTTFLLDLEKMVVLQLNEIQKSPITTKSILVDEQDLNTFKFEELGEEKPVCIQEPFVIVGDTAPSIPTPHGSRETLASNVDLPMIRLQRQFIYAKCDKFHQVKAFLESQRCKCRDGLPRQDSPDDSDESVPPAEPPPPAPESESSNEPLLMDDITILRDCPIRRCQDWVKKYSFPYLNNYLDFTEEKYIRVKDILGKPPKKNIEPELVDPREIVRQELPFAATKEKYHHVETQYSSQEDIGITNIKCPCTDEFVQKVEDLTKPIKSKDKQEKQNKEINAILAKRKMSLERVINENPNLLKLFTDESFDFIYTLKI